MEQREGLYGFQCDENADISSNGATRPWQLLPCAARHLAWYPVAVCFRYFSENTIESMRELNMKSLLALVLVVVCTLLFGPVAYCQNPELAKDLAEEGVSNEAKVEFIKVLHDST